MKVVTKSVNTFIKILVSVTIVLLQLPIIRGQTLQVITKLSELTCNMLKKVKSSPLKHTKNSKSRHS